MLTDKMTIDEVIKRYDDIIEKAQRLMRDKDADYGAVWQEMRPMSITDQIFIKARRIQQIEENDGKMKVSEGIESELIDIINYCVFRHIMEEKEDVELDKSNN